VSNARAVSPCLTDEEIRVSRNIQSVFDRQQKRASALFMMGGATMFAGDR
jgi:hypothetical protein